MFHILALCTHCVLLAEFQVLGDNLAKVQSTCQDLAREKMAAQEQLDKLDQEKASVEKQLVDARREIQELKASVSVLSV